MAREIRIVSFWYYMVSSGVGADAVKTAERELSTLVNDGWRIVVAGGGGATTDRSDVSYRGFVVLERER